MTLVVGATPACPDHRCDACDRCKSGDCCGQDVYEALLPIQGSYPDPIHGTIGKLNINDTCVQCHICGEWFINLGSHTALKHKITSEDYRAYFGLAVTMPLCHPTMSEARANTAEQMDSGSRGKPHLVRLTSEQYSVAAYKREARESTKVQRRAHLTSEFGKRANDILQKKRLEDPTYATGIRVRQIRTRRRKVGDHSRICPYCNAWFCPIRAKHPLPVTCRQPECIRAAKVRGGSVSKRRNP